MSNFAHSKILKHFLIKLLQIRIKCDRALFEEQFAPLPFNLPQIQNKLPSGWIRACVISSRQLTMWAIQTHHHIQHIFILMGLIRKGIALSLFREQITYTIKFVLLTTFVKKTFWGNKTKDTEMHVIYFAIFTDQLTCVQIIVELTTKIFAFLLLRKYMDPNTLTN